MKKIPLIALVLLLAVLFYTLRLYRLDGTSMNYGLTEGDMVLSYRPFSSIRRGDMLVMRHPEDPQNRLYIKRCAALPGDSFFQKERAFYLQIESNSTKTRQMAQAYDLELAETKDGYFIKEPYVKYYGVVHNRRLTVPTELDHIPLSRVAADHYYLLGDYRDNSSDSRFFGAVPRHWIQSKVIYIFKTPRSWQTLLHIKEVD